MANKISLFVCSLLGSFDIQTQKHNLGHKVGKMIEERVPSKVSHSIREAKDSSADHGGNSMEGGVPPLGWP